MSRIPSFQVGLLMLAAPMSIALPESGQPAGYEGYQLVRITLGDQDELAPLTVAARAQAQQPGPASRPAAARGEFMHLCQRALDELREPSVRPFFIHSYMVRALAVAYDETSERRYLDACVAWTDSMLAHQADMVPAGAYYHGYHRRPGESSGQWFLADSSSIAMGVLATAARCEPPRRQRYIASARHFADMVIERFVRASGGVTDGYWDKSDREWWCSTALFGAFCYTLYEQTHEPRYLSVAEDTTRWLLAFDYRRDATTPTFKKGAPSVLFYILEDYTAAAALARPELRARARRARRDIVAWLVAQQQADGSWPYAGWWATKAGGLACHLYVHARARPAGDALGAADRALEHLSRVLAGADDRYTVQRLAFALLAWAERVGPGGTYPAPRP